MPNLQDLITKWLKKPVITDDERMDFEERATIMEFDGELPREEAERRALEIVLNRRKNGTVKSSTT